MTVPASSLLTVLPGAPLLKTGSGAGAPAAGATGFEALLAGLVQGGAQAGSARGPFAAPEADADLAAEDAALAQDLTVASLPTLPGQAPGVVVPPLTTTAGNGADGVAFAARQNRGPVFQAWRPAEDRAVLPARPATEPATPVVGQFPEVDAAALTPNPASPAPSLVAPFMDSRAGRTIAPPTPADVSVAAPSTFATPAPDAARPATAPAVPIPTVAPAPLATPAPPAAGAGQTQTLVPLPVDRSAPAAPAAVAAAPAPAPAPARSVAGEGEPRRAAATRNDRRGEASGLSSAPATDAKAEASPARLAALAAATPDLMNGGLEADLAGDPSATDAPEIAEARQPAQTADARGPAAPAAAMTTDAVAARATPETVARFAADVVRKLEGQSTRFDIQLDPHGLGKVDVAIEIDRHGKLTAAMSFDSPQSAADLGSRAADLRLALEQAGFDVADDGLTFDLAGQGAGFGGREAGQREDRAWNGRAFQRAQAGAEDADLSLTPTPSFTDRRTRSGVDIRI